MMMFRNKSVNTHSFAMVPRAEIPRSRFTMQRTLKTTFNAGALVPIFCEEILPGDSWNCRATLFTRLATPLFPVMDNLHMETFWFFVPARLVWDNWVKFMGEQKNPGDSISFVIPKMTSPAGGYAPNSLFDYFGLPTVGQVAAGATVTHSALPLRCYNLIYDEWFRDENLSTALVVDHGDGPDTPANFVLAYRLKRHDYFTSCLPWPIKGGVQISIPLGGYAEVRSSGNDFQMRGGAAGAMTQIQNGGVIGAALETAAATANGVMNWGPLGAQTTGLYADLTTATAATINQIRQSFQIQRLLERDARGGTRYTEILQAHFGVNSPDARLQRPEYLGGGSTPITVNPVAQTSATGPGPGNTPLGNLAAAGTGLAVNHGFTQSFVEHGYVIGIVQVRADLTYQQGLRRLWSRNTRYDFYFPAFAMLGEQAVLSREIYCDGTVGDDLVFGYQERWAEYRNLPSQITGLFRSTTAGTLDAWHLAQRFTVRPLLASGFIGDDPPVSRIVAVGAGANGAQFLMDGFFDITAARPLPMYSVPGLIDHF